jgi:hypothetical protein
MPFPDLEDDEEYEIEVKDKAPPPPPPPVILCSRTRPLERLGHPALPALPPP